MCGWDYSRTRFTLASKPPAYPSADEIDPPFAEVYANVNLNVTPAYPGVDEIDPPFAEVNVTPNAFPGTDDY